MDKAAGYKIARRKSPSSPLMSSLNGKAHCHLSIPKNIPFFLSAGGESADVLQRWCRAACYILIYLILFNLGHFPSPGGSSSHGCMHALAQHAAESTLNFAFLSLPPRSYLLVLEVVRTLSAPDASPAARLIWIQEGNMDWSRLGHPPPDLRVVVLSGLLEPEGQLRITKQGVKMQAELNAGPRKNGSTIIIQ